MTPTPRFHFALSYASALHQEQRRKGKSGEHAVPYVVHLLGVCAIVIQNGGSEDEAIAALLHDAVEDQGGKAEAERIRALFGDVVARIVLGCTDSFVDTAGGEKKLPWIARKRDYLARLREEGDDVAFVSAADKLDNARATERDVAAQGDRLWQIFNAPKARTIAYYRELIAVYATKAARVQPIVRELRAIIERIGADVPADATMESASA
jgi:(p)ppGpp synthase/HD superfamily hydrolase